MAISVIRQCTVVKCFFWTLRWRVLAGVFFLDYIFVLVVISFTRVQPGLPRQSLHRP